LDPRQFSENEGKGKKREERKKRREKISALFANRIVVFVLPYVRSIEESGSQDKRRRGGIEGEREKRGEGKGSTKFD